MRTPPLTFAAAAVLAFGLGCSTTQRTRTETAIAGSPASPFGS